MIRTTDKKRIVIYVICAFLFIMAGYFQAVDSLLPAFWHALFSFLTHTILISLVVLWGVSLIHRMVRKDLLIFFVAIAILILFFLVVRMIKYGLTEEADTLSRYLWYSYYVPQCLIPPTLFLAVMSTENKKGKPLKKVWYLLYLPAILLITIIYTNDIHECVFTLYFNDGEFSYKHQIVFYIALSWEIMVTFASLIGMFFKCSVSASKKKMWIPICTFITCALVSTICFLVNTKSFKIPELLCFTCIVVIESCISIGLIPSNYEYENFFYQSAYSAIITNKTFDVLYYSKKAPMIDKKIFKEAIKSPVMIDKNTRLLAESIHGGYVFRNEDLTQIRLINEELEEANERITDENYLIKAENKIREQKAQIAEQNRLYAMTEEYTYDELNRLEQVLLKIKQEKLLDSEFKKEFCYACVLAAYIKRRSNLVMLTEKNKNVDAGELLLSLKESLDYLSLIGTECSLDFTIKDELPGEIIGVIYDFFETTVVMNEKVPNAIFVHIWQKEKEIEVLIESDAICNTLDTSNFIKEKFSRYLESINIKIDDDVIYYSLHIPLGGGL